MGVHFAQMRPMVIVVRVNARLSWHDRLLSRSLPARVGPGRLTGLLACKEHHFQQPRSLTSEKVNQTVRAFGPCAALSGICDILIALNCLC